MWRAAGLKLFDPGHLIIGTPGNVERREVREGWMVIVEYVHIAAVAGEMQLSH